MNEARKCYRYLSIVFDIIYKFILELFYAAENIAIDTYHVGK